MSRARRANTEPSIPNSSRCSGRQSAFAPASSSTRGPSDPGSTVTMAGRLTPRTRFTSSRPAASIAPVLPAPTKPSALPSATVRAPTAIDDRGRERTAFAGSSSDEIVPSLSTISTSADPSGTRGPSTSGRPTKSTCSLGDATASAPATISAGAWSPPSASRANVTERSSLEPIDVSSSDTITASPPAGPGSDPARLRPRFSTLITIPAFDPSRPGERRAQSPLRYNLARMRTLIRMMKIFLGPHKVGVALSLVLALATTGMGMFVPWLTKLAVDRALVPQRGDLVTVFAAAIVGVGLLRMVFAFCRRIVSGRVALAVETEVRNRLFDHLQTLGLDFHLRSQTGQLMSRAIADVRAVRMFLGYGLIFVMTNVATLVGVTVILLLLQPRLAIMSLAPLPLILVVARAFSKRLHPSLWAIQQRVAELTAVAEERIMGIGVIKAFAIEHLQAEAFEAASDRIYRQNLEAAAIKGRYVPRLGMLPSISLMIILFYGGRAVIADQMTLGSLVAFNGYVMLLIWPMRMLGMLVSWGERAVASGERVLEILEESPTVRDSPRASALAAVRGVLEFDDVSFEYGGRRVIDGVTVRIERGETVALVGPTGCLSLIHISE